MRRASRNFSFELSPSSKYEAVRQIGYGSSSVVWYGRNKETKERVAIKKVCNALQDEKTFKKVLRETNIMNHFSHENLIGLKDVFEDFRSCYIVMEIMDTDLGRVISSGKRFALEDIQLIIYQILRGLKCLHSADVLHKDLKPQNCLLNCNFDLKICDFGSGSVVSHENEAHLVNTTLWYRAPELLSLSSSKGCTSAVDIWSAGCILAELFLGVPLFKGEDQVDQLEVIESAFTLTVEESKTSSLLSLLSELPVDAVDLLSKMLAYDPLERISAADALAHPFLRTLHDPEDEPDAVGPLPQEYQSSDDLYPAPSSESLYSNDHIFEELETWA